MGRLLRLNHISISIFYGILAIGWILFSDTLLLHSSLPPASALRLEMIKGTLFVVATMMALCCMMRTMTQQIERNRAAHEAELRESEARFSTAFGSSPEGMSISVIEGGRCIEANAVLLFMLGYSRAELVGTSSLELAIWADAADRAELLSELAKGPVNRFRTRFRRKDGRTLDVELSGDKIQLHGQSHLLLITRDVTEQLELEHQFQQAQKLEAVAQVAAGVAHDFKNLLLVISACTEMLEVTGENNVGLKDQIQATVKKSATLARQLMAFSRRQKLTPEVLDLNSIFTELWNILPQLTGTGINASLEVCPTIWRIYADRGQFDQVVMNLTVNARDAMPTGGSLTISASNLTLKSDSANSNGELVPAGDYVQLQVSDTGHGMSNEIMSKLFQPFFTTKAQGKGTGLGLAAVHSIVKQSGGFVSVESERDKGSTFRMLWPRHSQEAGSSVTAQLETKSAA